MPVHGIDDGNNKHDVYTAEEVLSILQQAIDNGTLQGIDPEQNPIVAAVRENHNNSDITFWSGTEAEFNELVGVTSELIGARIGSDGRLYLLTGDTTLSDTVEAARQAALEATEGMKREVISVTLLANGWSNTAPYTQTVAVPGMTSDKDFLAPYVVPTGNESDDLAAQAALSCISGGTTDTDSVTFYCYDEKPTTTITVFMVDKGTKIEPGDYPIASTSQIGMVKVGDGLNVDQAGELSVAAYEASGYFFDNVAAMVAYNLAEGDTAITAGYYSTNDGGAATYKIISSGATADGGSLIALDNGLKAQLIVDASCVKPEQFGAVADGSTDDGVAINKAIQFAYTKNAKVVLSKSYSSSVSLALNEEGLNLEILNRLTYTGSGSAIEITSNRNNVNINKLYSSGTGITLKKTAALSGALEANHINVEYVNSTDNCIELLAEAGGNVYNEIRFTTLISSTSHYCIYISSTGSSFVGENTLYGGKCQRGLWGVYATSDHSGGVPAIKAYNICFEGVANGIYFNNVLASIINYPRYAELEQSSGAILLSINGNTVDCIFNGNHPIDLTKVVANSSATSTRMNFINAPIMNTGGTTIAARAAINKNGFALFPHCVKYRNVTSSWANHVIDETEFQPQYFKGNYAATITLNNSYIPEVIPFFYVEYDGASRLTIEDQDGNTAHDGTGLDAGIYKVNIYQEGSTTKYFTEKVTSV